MALLVVISGGSRGSHPLGADTTLGRDPSSTILLTDARVSRNHATLRRAPDGSYVLRDSASSHGTYVGGQRITECVLRHGDELVLGGARLRFEAPVQASNAAPWADGAARALHRSPPLGGELRFAPEGDVADERTLRRDYEKLRIAYELTRQVGTEHELSRLIERILDAAFELLAADRGAILLVNPETGEPTLRISRSRDGHDKPPELSQTLIAEALAQKTGVLLADVAQDDRFNRAGSMLAAGTRSAMCVPMLYRDEVLGVMVVDSPAGTSLFGEKDLELFTTIATQAALTLKTATLRERVQSVVIEERHRLDRIVRYLPVGVVLLDPHDRVVLANQEAQALLPSLGGAKVGERLERLGTLALADVADRHAPEPSELTVEGPPRRIVMLTRASLEQFGASTAHGETLLLLQDVTMERQREQEAARAERLALVGQLSGSIAHDFNNLLSVIINYSEFLSSELRGTRLEEDIGLIRQAGQKGGALTRQLLAFSRREIAKPVVLELNRVVRGLEALLARASGEAVDLTVDLAADLWNVKADPGRIEQVLMNLAVNARDAMPRGGALILETFNEEVPGQRLRAPESLPPGRYAVLRVRDTGEGMTPEVQARVFEPFFTTKEAGRGTGLGLATVHGIVKQAGGAIWFESAAGTGTAAYVCLPATDEPLTGETPAPRTQTERGAGRMVLVAEDEDRVRRLTSRVLTDAGYRVLEARDGSEALRLVEENAEMLALVITDVVMPKMSGTDLARALEARSSQLPVIFVSGYLELLEPLGAARGRLAILEKPFTPHDLLARVGEALRPGAARPRPLN